MGGGISMGAYSAGALAYVIKSLESELNKDSYDSCTVDVFSGLKLIYLQHLIHQIITIKLRF